MSTMATKMNNGRASARPISHQSSTTTVVSLTDGGQRSASSSVTTIGPHMVESKSAKDSDIQIVVSPKALLEDQPTSHRRGWLSKLRHGLFNTYSRLFLIMIISNAIPLIAVLARDFSNSSDLTSTCSNLVSLCIHMAAGNAMVCTLARSPLVINAMFLTFGAIPRSAPLWLRRRCCKVFHFGGVHSGAGIATCIWMILFVILFAMTKPWENPRPAAIFGVGIFLAMLLLSIVIVAIPSVRRRQHDTFEMTHRFAGWLTLVVLWVLLLIHAWDQVVLGSSTSIGAYLLPFPTFWFLLVSTTAAIWPWAMLRKVEVNPEYLSPHATRLHFRHRPLGWGRGLSLAKHPLKDWHSFAGFSDRFDSPQSEFSCLVSNAGDWTKSVIQDRPTKLWVRAIPVYGVGYGMKLFNRVVMVATGSGIGPCLSFIGYHDRPPIRVIWQTRSPLKTYGQRTLDLVERLDKNPIVYDTTQTGRMDMLPVTCDVVESFQAEAVIVISNPAMTKKLVYELEMRGIPAYGPIFDS
ncbi:putative Integral membrane protein TmpA [Seiridium cardinale]|uniref:Integral membrane protein TmpA n=1 Tax=Seiridium cardinale TaxID=138064 RepID=A0ABR2XVW7_9PEZI